ncbi:MAG TPA: stage II sporulation protein M [Candidatus Binatia bacterium]|nr:stage II sporulation protein M [Candidatus Binatia bacterium]
MGYNETMDARQLFRRRRDDWQRLSELLDIARRDVRSLSPYQVAELSRLYRSATGDLALAQRDFPEAEVTRFLNQLVARGHATIYQEEPIAFDRLRRFARAGFPSTVRTLSPFILAAAAFFVIPALLLGLATAWNPQAASRLLPAQLQELVPMIEQQELWTDVPLDQRPYTSAFIMRNNIQVIFLSFAGGVLLGLFTLYILVVNGVIIGGLTGLTVHYGVGFELWTFVIGHGVIELSVIFMAGGAGLALGWAIIHPGLLSRRDSLARAARLSIRIVVGAVPLLLVAGAIEGFISPNETIPWFVKWLIGIVSGLLLYGYLLFSGRQS